MLEKNFSIIDYLVFGVFLSFSTLIGIYFALKNRKNPSKDEFLTGGKNLDVFPVCMSLIASFLSSNTILGVPAEIYLFGTQYSLHLITFTIAVLLAANVFMPVYYKLNLTSVHKYLLRRFGMNAVRLSGSIGFILCTLPYLGVVLYGPSIALASVTPLSVTTSILVVGVICTFYTSIGGIKAVIWTDVMQTILMFSGLLMVAIVGSIESGFIESWKIAYNNNRLNIFNPTFSLYRGDIFWSVFFGTLTGWTGTYCVKQTQVQRYCCLGSPAKAKKALYWNIPGVLIISFIAIWCGIVIFAKYNGCDPIALGFIDKHDQLMPYFVMDTLSNYPGLPGLFVCCVFSGSLSTLSSGFNALATVTWDDFIKRYFRDIKEKKQLMITKIIAMSYGILAIAIAFFIGRLGTVLQASHALTGSITGPLLALFCLGIFFPCVNAIGAITGLISGVGMCLFITIGTLVYPRPKGFQLPVSVNSCPAEIIEHISYDTFISATQRHYSVDYHPKGILQIFHINYMYISFIGFIVTLIVGPLVSQICERFLYKNKFIARVVEISDHSQLSPIVHRLCPLCIKSENLNTNETTLKTFSTQNKNVDELDDIIPDNPLIIRKDSDIKYIDDNSDKLL